MNKVYDAPPQLNSRLLRSLHNLEALNQASYRMLFHEFRHIYAQQRIRAVK